MSAEVELQDMIAVIDQMATALDMTLDLLPAEIELSRAAAGTRKVVRKARAMSAELTTRLHEMRQRPSPEMGKLSAGKMRALFTHGAVCVLVPSATGPLATQLQLDEDALPIERLRNLLELAAIDRPAHKR